MEAHNYQQQLDRLLYRNVYKVSWKASIRSSQANFSSHLMKNNCVPDGHFFSPLPSLHFLALECFAIEKKFLPFFHSAWKLINSNALFPASFVRFIRFMNHGGSEKRKGQKQNTNLERESETRDEKSLVQPFESKQSKVLLACVIFALSLLYAQKYLLNKGKIKR